MEGGSRHQERTDTATARDTREGGREGGRWRGNRGGRKGRRSRIGIKFIDPVNRTYGVDLPEYQNTEIPKYQMSKVPNTLMRSYIFVTIF
jgi:hypothetical protein